MVRVDHEQFVLQSQSNVDLSDKDDSDPFMKQFLKARAEKWCEEKKVEHPDATFQIGSANKN